MKREYRIAKSNFEKLNFEIARLNRRAAKIGASPVVLTDTGRFEDEEVRHPVTNEVTHVNRYLIIEVAGETPKFAGWQLAACVEHSEEGNILRKTPDCKVELTQYRTGKSCCEHCNTVRNRRETYILLHDSGSLKRVGSDCIKDFLGHADPHKLARMAEFLFSVDELCDGAGDEGFFGGDGGGRRLLRVIAALSFAACAIRRLGFISGKRAHEDMSGHTQSTSMTTSSWMNPGRNWVLGKDYFTPTDDDRAAAEKAQAYVLETLGAKAPEKLSDFEHNLLTACRCEAVEPKNVGLLAFVPEYYSRALEQAKQAATEIYFGEVKKRYKNIPLTYLKSTGWDGNYGYTYLHTFSGPDNVRILWKSQNNISEAPGYKLVATFTVKAHEEFKGHKQTKVSRMVWESIEKVEVPA